MMSSGLDGYKNTEHTLCTSSWSSHYLSTVHTKKVVFYGRCLTCDEMCNPQVFERRQKQTYYCWWWSWCWCGWAYGPSRPPNISLSLYPTLHQYPTSIVWPLQPPWYLIHPGHKTTILPSHNALANMAARQKVIQPWSMASVMLGVAENLTRPITFEGLCFLSEHIR